MLTILPCGDRQKVAQYCKQCGKIWSEAFYLYLAENRGEILAAGLFEVQSDRVEVIHYEANDKDDAFLLDGILRAGLNYADQQGIENGLIPEALRHTYRELFAKLNYPVHPLFNIVNFFQKYKNCKTQS